MRLLCFHHAGGGASGYRSWAKSLDDEVELVLVQLPGREDRISETPLIAPDDVLDELICVLQGTLDRPYAIVGHSLGAMLGHSLACRAQSTGELPVPFHIFLSGAPAPAAERDAGSRVAAQDDAELVARLRKLGGTPTLLLENLDYLGAILPTFRADAQLCLELEARESCRLDIPLTILWGSNDPIVPREAAQRWSEFTTSNVQIKEFPGGHFFINEFRDSVLSTVNGVLARGPL